MVPDDLVVDDYYKEGMAINRRLSAEKQAGLMEITAELTALDESDLTLAISGLTNEPAVKMNWYHVTDETRDVGFTLVREKAGIYHTTLDDQKLLEPGVWYIELAGLDGTWRLKARVETPLSEWRVTSDG